MNTDVFLYLVGIRISVRICNDENDKKKYNISEQLIGHSLASYLLDSGFFQGVKEIFSVWPNTNYVPYKSTFTFSTCKLWF